MGPTSVDIGQPLLAVLDQVGASISGASSVSADLEVVALVIAGGCTGAEMGVVGKCTGAVADAVVGCMGVATDIVGSCTQAGTGAGSVEGCTGADVTAAVAAAKTLLFGTPQP